MGVDVKLHMFWSSPGHQRDVEWSVVLRLLYFHGDDGSGGGDDDDAGIKPADLNIRPRFMMHKGKSYCSQCRPF